MGRNQNMSNSSSNNNNNNKNSAGSKNGHTIVQAKELRSISFHKQLVWYFGVDFGPFFVLYSILAAVTVSQFLQSSKSGIWICSIATGVIAIIHILTLLFTQWSVEFKTFAHCSKAKNMAQATHVKVIPADYVGSRQLVPLVKRQMSDGEHEIYFEYQKIKFVYDHQKQVFSKLMFPVEEPLSTYLLNSGYGSEQGMLSALEKWGPNKFEVPVPQFIDLLKEQMLAPFFVFQVFCVLLWCLDEYLGYSLFTLSMLVVFECTVVGQRQRSLRELRSLQTPKQALNVYRGGKWDKLPGDALVPGDLISVARPSGQNQEDKVMPADAVLISGTCICDEAVLTGESIPQWKTPIQSDFEGQVLNIKTDKGSILFGGTKIIQNAGDKNARIRTPDNGALAVVIRTGFETAQGSLMRTILFTTERITANNLESGLFILFLLIFAVAAAGYVVYHGLQDPEINVYKLYLHCAMIITSVIPPELPMELTMAVNSSLIALARKRVFCTEPFRIPFAGKVQVCCFDKTGTLTSDNMVLEGIAGISDDVVKADGAGEKVTWILAACHSLVNVDKQVVGDPLEKAAFTATAWAYDSENALSPDKKTKITILHRFRFTSTLKRMAAIIRVEAESRPGPPQHYVVVKGAPEIIQDFIIPSQQPSKYEEVHRRYAARGARVIALAFKKLHERLGPKELRELSREEVESELYFGGFAIFQTPIKEESEPALKMLKESSHQLVMITGDAPLTAVFIASKVHIVTRSAVILQRVTHDSDLFQWVSPDESTRIEFSPERAQLLEVARNFDLCLSGDALSHTHSLNLDSYLIPLVQVFARVTPEQKELIVKTLRSNNKITLMCGDGTNDVGALKAAHVGVALLSTQDKPKPPKPVVDKDLVKQDAKSSKDGKKKEVLSQGQKLLADMRKKGRPITPAMEKWADWLDSMEAQSDGQVPALKPGDASMASPFSAKHTHVLPCTDIIRQGRCTLVTTVQMFKILGLMCLSSAYSLSVMFLNGVKLGDIQATAAGFLTAAMFFFISHTKPLQDLSPVRPHPNIFSWYVFLSMMGQFGLHLAFLFSMYQGAKAVMSPEEIQSKDSDFKPNLVNTICYIVNAFIQITTFAVNYVGYPFNTPLKEHKLLWKSVIYGVGALLVLALNLVPFVTEGLELVVIPPTLRSQLLIMGVLDFAGCWFLEHFLRDALPAKLPPEKGYMEYVEKLENSDSKKAL